MQSAREAARCIQCTNNLKQLGLAFANYESAIGCLPSYGLWAWNNADDMSAFLRMAPYYEQMQVFNAYNTVVGDVHNPANITIPGVGISTLWCPSDPNAQTAVNLSAPYPGLPQYTVGWDAGYRTLPPGTWNMYGTNYRGCEGIFEGASNGLGVYLAHRLTPAITLASISDGTSNTLAFSEMQADIYGWQVSSSGFETRVGPNPPQPGYMTPTSYHPGGVNASFADGSVHFIKNGINSWNDPAVENQIPGPWFTISQTFSTVGGRLFITTNYNLTSIATLGVWQALSTRGNGEVISRGGAERPSSQTNPTRRERRRGRGRAGVPDASVAAHQMRLARSGDSPSALMPSCPAPPVSSPSPPFPSPRADPGWPAEVLHCPLAFQGTHLLKEFPAVSQVAYHYCKPMGDELVARHGFYDGHRSDARLIGVEYLVTTEVFEKMPAEEKAWHDHKYEVDAGLLNSLTQTGAEEKATLAKVRTLHGKIFHTWSTGKTYPQGPARLFWAVTGEDPFVLPPGRQR